MFAIIKTGGKQYKVSAGDKIKIEKLEALEGDNVVFDEVLLVADDQEMKIPSTSSGNNIEKTAEGVIKIGQPFIEGAKVEGKILKQAKDKKVIIFKYKAKKRYKVKRGHRQMFSEVEILKIS